MSSENSIRLILKSYDWRALDDAVRTTIRRIEGTNVHIAGPVPLPTRRRRFTVLRGPHIDKKSREHFELAIRKRLLILSGVGKAEALRVLSDMELPAALDADLD